MGSQRSKEDDVQKISTSVRSKAGKRFGFVHFIKVFDVERLVNNLCMIWVGRHQIHANVARFQKVSMNNSSSQFKKNGEKRNHTHNVSTDKGTKGPVNSYVHVPQSMNLRMESNPVLVLDESCVNQQVYAYCLLGKVKEFASLTNLKVVLVSEGFDNVKLRHMGGFWVMLEFSSEEVKMKFQSSVGIGNWFSQLQQASSDFIIDGKVTWVELKGISSKMKRVCINIIGYFNILESFKIIYQGRAYWVRTKEVSGWVHDFVKENDEVVESDDESLEVEPNCDNLNNDDDVRWDSEIDEVPDTIFEEKLSHTNGDESFVENKEIRSEDPFNIYDLLKTKKIDNKKDGEVQSTKRNVPVDERDEGTHNIHEEVEASEAKKPDSKKNSKGDEVYGCLTGNKCLLSRYMLLKNYPKKMLWDYLSHVIANWKGEVIIMGDFNEVRNKAERFGSMFNVQGANAFNMFISSAGLEEVPLGDKGDGNDDVIQKRTNVVESILKVEKLQSMEAAQKAKIKVVDARMFKGVVLGHLMQLSHMFYADDVVFVGQWNDSNIDTIVHVLDCFYRASGLRINMSKSKLMGISVDKEKVNQATSKIVCVALKAHFSYLGSKVGGIMSRILSWNEIVDSMIVRLSKWKMKTLSIGGRLTLLKSVLGSMPIYHIALMFKWVWRLVTQRNSLWTRVIKAIHGDDGKIRKSSKGAFSSIWLDIVHEIEIFKKQGIDGCSFIPKNLGNGKDTTFWEEVWREDEAFKYKFPRLYALETCKGIDVDAKLAHISLDYSFRRDPMGGVEQA
nr:RNA-directed DNA polymerase, eukaryota, reverse transcriptase zinc-binding domain protein [Tanacetum cinerariifolium]